MSTEQDSHVVELDELLVRPGTYFNPQTEVVVIVDDSPTIEQEIFNMEPYEGADWVRISDDVPVDEEALEVTLEAFQTRYHLGAGDSVSETALEQGDEEYDDGENGQDPGREDPEPEPDPEPEAELEPSKPDVPGKEVPGRATVGLAGRALSVTEAAAFDAFAARVRPLGWVENPFRTGSWGEVVAGKFRELGRIDVAEVGKPGWRGRTHIHITGQAGHLDPLTPLPGE